MAGIFSSLRTLARVCQPFARSPLQATAWRAARLSPLRSLPTSPPFASSSKLLLAPFAPRAFHTSPPACATLNQATRRKHKRKPKRPTSPLLENNTQKKGVVSQIFLMKPKKPNSAKRKVAKVKLTNGRTVQAYIMGEGHNLQEHSVVLVRGGRAQDLPGVR